MSVLKLTASRKEMELEVDDQKFLIREMTGTAFTEYLRNQGKRLKVGADGKQIGLPDPTDMFSDLITKCLLQKSSDGMSWEPVKKELVDKWPRSTCQAIFTECQRLNGLIESAENTDPKKAETLPD